MMKLPARIVLLTGLALVVGGMLALLPLVAESGGPREVVVVARQMSFYVGDDTRPNPTIRVTSGERIRVTLVNDDSGFDHDFAVTAWSVGTPVLRGQGRTSVVLQAPRRPGRVDYVCTFHASMMTGTIEVMISGQSGASER